MQIEKLSTPIVVTLSLRRVFKREREVCFIERINTLLVLHHWPAVIAMKNGLAPLLLPSNRFVKNICLLIEE